VGADPDQVQGGGGNTSVKTRDGKTMYVKASGTALLDMTETLGWAEMDLEGTRALLQDNALSRLGAQRRELEVARRLSLASRGPQGVQPSVEASLHALLDRVVIHTHPLGLNAFLCSRDSRRRFARLFASTDGEPLYLPYCDPGYTLAKRFSEALEDYVERVGSLPKLILLENHGLFVSGRTTRECLLLTGKATEVGRKWTGRKQVNPVTVGGASSSKSKTGRRGTTANGAVEVRETGDVTEAALRGALLRAGCAPLLLQRDTTTTARDFLRNPDAQRGVRRGAFTPDQIMYCRTVPLTPGSVTSGRPRASAKAAERSLKQSEKEARAYRERFGLDPRVIVLAGQAVYYMAPDLPRLATVAEVFRGAMLALLSSKRGGGPRFLDRKQAAFVEEWETHKDCAELPAGVMRRFTGRVAAVTGAGSGLGKGIAMGLLEEGATVFALDINQSLLAEVAASTRGGRYIPVQVDVTDETSVREAFAQVELLAGGVDFLVNAAGIAPSFSLVDFPLDAWNKTLAINLTGYFLCGREFVRVLERQGVGGSIVNLTSKSGLEASKENSAYNTTKAGEIHLMRGWALELGGSGIRVNCVAPGNVFKGSQIWNPQYIRACARKKGIRPEEVIPYYTSLAPLGKEIEPSDIASAVSFLLSDEARNVTGQTLVVDGGQVSVR
jgi:sorbitol-6-phosphate 2-dehydrogenase